MGGGFYIRHFFAVVSAFTLSTTAHMSAQAAEDSGADDNDAPKDGWGLSTITEISGTHRTPAGYTLYTLSEDDYGLIFHCAGGEMDAGLGVKPGNIMKTITKQKVDSDGTQRVKDRLRATSRTGKLQIGDREQIRSRWILYAVEGYASPRQLKTSRQIFNGVVRNDTMNFSIGRFKDITIKPPKPAPELFNEFTSQCALQ